MKIVTFFDRPKTNVIFLRYSNSNYSKSLQNGQDYSPDEETPKHVREMDKTQKLAFEGMLQYFLTNARNNRDTPSWNP